MARKKEISMQRIADELGISKVTVSKALNKKDGVSQELKMKIFRLAEAYGYTLPDYGKRKSKKVAVIMSDRFASSSDVGRFYMRMYDKIVCELRKFSCTTIMITLDDASTVKELETVEEQGMFDGIILLGILGNQVQEKIKSISLPKVYVDIYDREHKSDSVISENIYSMYEITRYVVKNGHRNIGFVGTVGVTTSISDRYLGYVRALLESGYPIKQEWMLADRNEDGEAVKLQLPEHMPTAFICNCDETAYRLTKVLKESGYQIPDDISVVGFDDDIYAELCEPKLTTVAVNADEIGRMAVKRIMKRMDNPNRKGGEVFRIPGKAVFRKSVKAILPQNGKE